MLAPVGTNLVALVLVGGAAYLLTPVSPDVFHTLAEGPAPAPAATEPEPDHGVD